MCVVIMLCCWQPRELRAVQVPFILCCVARSSSNGIEGLYSCPPMCVFSAVLFSALGVKGCAGALHCVLVSLCYV
jgi:hypothetical protein